MSDYARANSGGATHFTDKDALTTGDSNKKIVGAQFDAEFNAILTATNSKYDSADVASQSQAEGETLNDKIITPLGLSYWSDAGAGFVGDIHALSDPNADTILGWDDSAGAVINFTIGTGLGSSTTNITLSHLGLENLTDPNADRLMYWDDSDGAMNWLTVDNGLSIDSDDTMGITDVTGSTTNAVTVTSGTFAWDDSSLTEITAAGLSQAQDGFLVSDNGTLKRMPYDDAGAIVQTAQTTQTLAKTDANTIMEFNGTATVTIPLAATHGFVAGQWFLICVDHATQVVTVTADTSVTLNSTFHPGGATDSDTVRAGGTAVALYLGSEEWYLSGDIAD